MQVMQAVGESVEQRQVATTLAIRVNRRLAMMPLAMRRALLLAKSIGDELLQAKRAINKGEWSAWLSENIKASPESARGYMRIAEHWDALKPALGEDPGLGIAAALATLRRNKSTCTLQPADSPLRCCTTTKPVQSLPRTLKALLRSLGDDAAVVIEQKWPRIDKFIRELVDAPPEANADKR